MSTLTTIGIALSAVSTTLANADVNKRLVVIHLLFLIPLHLHLVSALDLVVVNFWRGSGGAGDIIRVHENELTQVLL